jgi:murein DD-endopeptidase MepM/ murein hydrolase activator NlpD
MNLQTDCNGKPLLEPLFFNGFHQRAQFASHKRLIKPTHKRFLSCKIKVLQTKGHSLVSRIAVPVIAVSVLSATVLLPATVSAGVFSALGTRTPVAEASVSAPETASNSQQMQLVTASNIGPGTIAGKVATSVEVTPVITEAALTPSMGPVGNASEAEELPDTGGSISFYRVRAGDTISTVAEMFKITPGTLQAANNLAKGEPLKLGQTLVILPLSGTQYVVKSGDTISSIIKKTKANDGDFRYYNNLVGDGDLVVGETVIIPDQNYSGGIDTPAKTTTKTPTKTPSKTTTKTPSKSVAVAPMTADGLFTTNKNGVNNTPITVHPAKLKAKVDVSAQLVLPIDPNIGRMSQGLHQTNAIDIAAPLGTPIYAIADGTVLLERTGGYNDGFGNYVILLSIIDGNEVESIYGHMAKTEVKTGQKVSAGQIIGYVGRTGDATGNHLHLEIRGAKNTFVTKYRRQ